ncbi:hypothetical protein SAMN05421857_2229 [Chryseobacterium formosense]|nr:hypothetical protein SAMN05421857_2229 [Chryseobacterium formosense]
MEPETEKIPQRGQSDGPDYNNIRFKLIIDSLEIFSEDFFITYHPLN